MWRILGYGIQIYIPIKSPVAAKANPFEKDIGRQGLLELPVSDEILNHQIEHISGSAFISHRVGID